MADILSRLPVECRALVLLNVELEDLGRTQQVSKGWGTITRGYLRGYGRTDHLPPYWQPTKLPGATDFKKDRRIKKAVVKYAERRRMLDGRASSCRRYKCMSMFGADYLLSNTGKYLAWVSSNGDVCWQDLTPLPDGQLNRISSVVTAAAYGAMGGQFLSVNSDGVLHTRLFPGHEDVVVNLGTGAVLWNSGASTHTECFLALGRRYIYLGCSGASLLGPDWGEITAQKIWDGPSWDGFCRVPITHKNTANSFIARQGNRPGPFRQPEVLVTFHWVQAAPLSPTWNPAGIILIDGQTGAILQTIPLSFFLGRVKLIPCPDNDSEFAVISETKVTDPHYFCRIEKFTFDRDTDLWKNISVEILDAGPRPPLLNNDGHIGDMDIEPWRYVAVVLNARRASARRPFDPYPLSRPFMAEIKFGPAPGNPPALPNNHQVPAGAQQLHLVRKGPIRLPGLRAARKGRRDFKPGNGLGKRRKCRVAFCGGNHVLLWDERFNEQVLFDFGPRRRIDMGMAANPNPNPNTLEER
ncbi:F-box protein [Aspergillus mulundensis]|uniref:F-box domain-containing protein n=1 Tax=Aspergillus mulundensis TaxID=1810919 RepID=A0A3D8T2V1_9EURO|nr:hypothetical protein DSM5745_00093 [Aspergillus mulundensis]RDW92771.1 hypothetical protein DSM5745_00093 [Aspergillus mulundensis]